MKEIFDDNCLYHTKHDEFLNVVPKEYDVYKIVLNKKVIRNIIVLDRCMRT